MEEKKKQKKHSLFLFNLFSLLLKKKINCIKKASQSVVCKNLRLVSIFPNWNIDYNWINEYKREQIQFLCWIQC